MLEHDYSQLCSWPAPRTELRALPPQTTSLCNLCLRAELHICELEQGGIQEMRKCGALGR